jgi:hypothetical protein
MASVRWVEGGEERQDSQEEDCSAAEDLIDGCGERGGRGAAPSQPLTQLELSAPGGHQVVEYSVLDGHR